MPADRVEVICRAKLNLFLEVVRRRDDGFHDIETVFQPVTLHDVVRIERRPRGIELTGDDPGIPWDESNLCWKAAAMILGRSPSTRGVSIEVRKRIPSGAGLGGGSSDAAGVLAGINELYGLGMDTRHLMETALGIGSDVPFFLFGSPAVGRGRGEILERIGGLGRGTFLVVKPDISVSTEWAYGLGNLILTRSGGGNKLKRLLGGLKVFPDIALETSNSFQGVVAGEYPEIGRLLSLMERAGARLSSMSGSGSACFALFEDDTTASRVKDLMLGEGHSAWIVYPAGRTLVLPERE